VTDTKPSFQVDFNNIIEPDLVIISDTEERRDSTGLLVKLRKGMPVRVWDEDLGNDGQRDDLIAYGVVERNEKWGLNGQPLWCCRVDPASYRHQSDNAVWEERRHSEPADIQAVFRAGESGCWPEPYLTPEQLLELAEICVEHDRVICNVEAWLITNDAEIARPDLGYWEDDADRDLPGPARARKSHAETQAIVADARHAGGKVMFQVWLDWADRDH
jgi:hypothetical protein